MNDSEYRRQYRATPEGRERDRVSQFRRRKGADPCYVCFASWRNGVSVDVAVEDGVCEAHLRGPWVLGSDLSSLVRVWAERYELEHERIEKHRLEPDYDPDELDPTMTALEVLSERTARQGKRIPMFALEQILVGAWNRVDFYGMADPVAAAIGQFDRFSLHNGDLPVYGEAPLEEEVAA